MRIRMMLMDYYYGLPPVVEDFLRWQRLNLDHSDKTVDEYALDLRTFLRFMKRERGAVSPDTPFDEIDISDVSLPFINGITRIDVMNYIEYLRLERVSYEGTSHEKVGLAASSTQRKLACLKSFFDYWVTRREQVDKDPTIGVVPPRIRKTLPKFLTQEEGFKLLDAISGINEDRDYCIILLALTCGLRVSEIAAINVGDIRHTGGEHFLIIHGKGGKERPAFISKECVEALDAYLETREATYKPLEKHKNALFLSRVHKRISVDAVQLLVRNTCLKANIQPVSPHKLRHSAATAMIQNGVDVRAVQEVLGHANLATTQIYTHITNQDLQIACRANPLSKGRSHKAKEK